LQKEKIARPVSYPDGIGSIYDIFVSKHLLLPELDLVNSQFKASADSPGASLVIFNLIP
jgi:hypothetical protein